MEGSLCIGVENLKQTLLACVQLLSHYGNLSALYPQSYRQQHRTAQYVKLATAMTEEFTVAKSQGCYSEIHGIVVRFHYCRKGC